MALSIIAGQERRIKLSQRSSWRISDRDVVCIHVVGRLLILESGTNNNIAQRLIITRGTVPTYTYIIPEFTRVRTPAQ